MFTHVFWTDGIVHDSLKRNKYVTRWSSADNQYGDTPAFYSA